MTIIDSRFRQYMFDYMSWAPIDPHENDKPRFLREILDMDPDERRLPVNNREPRVLMSKQKYALIIDRDGIGCRYCYDGDGGIEIDHIIPRSAFPADRLNIADRSDNLCVSCRSCNQAKSNKAYWHNKRPGVTPACWECLNPSPDEWDEDAYEEWVERAATNRNHLVHCGRCGTGAFVPNLSWVL